MIKKEKMNCCLVQADIISEDKYLNFRTYERLLQKITTMPDIIIFPEMFSCGFLEKINDMSETDTGESVSFLKSVSSHYQCAVHASCPIKEDNKLYNRLFWIEKGEIKAYYDKRHLFFGCEKTYFSSGNQRIILSYHNWNFSPITCYDVRFPRWCRNQYFAEEKRFAYDVLIVTANFPASRAFAFQTLLTARAIENQTYVIAVNRIGKDGFNNYHKGQTQIIDPLGNIIAKIPDNQQGIVEYALDKNYLNNLRLAFPICEDWDNTIDDYLYK